MLTTPGFHFIPLGTVRGSFSYLLSFHLKPMPLGSNATSSLVLGAPLLADTSSDGANRGDVLQRD